MAEIPFAGILDLRLSPVSYKLSPPPPPPLPLRRSLSAPPPPSPSTTAATLTPRPRLLSPQSIARASKELLSTIECADGSVIFRFGSPDFKQEKTAGSSGSEESNLDEMKEKGSLIEDGDGLSIVISEKSDLAGEIEYCIFPEDGEEQREANVAVLVVDKPQGSEDVAHDNQLKKTLEESGEGGKDWKLTDKLEVTEADGLNSNEVVQDHQLEIIENGSSSTSTSTSLENRVMSLDESEVAQIEEDQIESLQMLASDSSVNCEVVESIKEGSQQTKSSFLDVNEIKSKVEPSDRNAEIETQDDEGKVLKIDGESEIEINEKIVAEAASSASELQVSSSGTEERDGLDDHALQLELPDSMTPVHVTQEVPVHESAQILESQVGDIQASEVSIAAEIDTNTETESSYSTMDDQENENAVGNLFEVEVSGTLDLDDVGVAGPDRTNDTATALLSLSSGAAILPHPSKALTGGEDAYFIAISSWFGVADGVGQWSFEGINAGLYARELMENCQKFVSQNDESKPDKILVKSAAESHSPGSSTVLVGNFDGQVLHVANIGDSGFIVIRNGSVSTRSTPMVYGFNFPLQIESGDDPSRFLETYTVDLVEGDVVVTATDGLFDNLYEKDITAIVSKSLQANLKPRDIAEILAVRAQEVGRSASAGSPFADAALAAGYPGFTGGKLDDVTVVVSIVEKKQPLL